MNRWIVLVDGEEQDREFEALKPGDVFRCESPVGTEFKNLDGHRWSRVIEASDGKGGPMTATDAGDEP